MSPYRTPAEMVVEPTRPERSPLARKWTRLKRRVLMGLFGTFKDRKLRNDHRDLWAILHESALKAHAEKARRKYREEHARQASDDCDVDQRGVHWR